jgi:hypothetical protein
MIRAHIVAEPPAHMGAAPRQGFHAGVRGTTGRDAQQRRLQEGTARMLAEVVEHFTRLASADGWILVGGIQSIARQLFELLPPALRVRASRLDALDVHASPAEIADAARHGVSAIRNAYDLLQLEDIIENAGTGGRAVLGATETHQALERGAVRELYLTLRYLEEHVAQAEEAVRAALRQGAIVEEVSGSAAERLDAHGGIAGRLRYPAGLAPAPADHVLTGWSAGDGELTS